MDIQPISVAVVIATSVTEPLAHTDCSCMGDNEADFISADLPALSFKQEYFSNPSFGDGEFSAAVKSPAEFFGRSVSATDMRVEVRNEKTAKALYQSSAFAVFYITKQEFCN